MNWVAPEAPAGMAERLKSGTQRALPDEPNALGMDW